MRAPVVRDSGGALDVTRDGGGARQRAEHGSESIGDEGAAGAREFSIAQKAALFANPHQRANVVKQIDEKEDKDQFAEAELESGAEVELEKCAGGMRQREKMRRPTREAKRDSSDGDNDDAEENGTADPAGHQDGDDDQA